MPWHDISVPLSSELATWPDSPGVQIARRIAIRDGGAANVTQLDIDVHSGTHIDAPLHVFDDGAAVDALGLEPFLGPAIVVDVGNAKELTAAVLEAATVPADAERLLLRTVNSSSPESYRDFDEDFAALTTDGAEWLAARSLRLVGIDYLSVQRFLEPVDVHRALLGSGIAVLEGLCLSGVAPGAYQLVCLPLRLIGVEGAPARAILLPLESEIL